AQSPVWGLVRAAQTEHPDRFLLVDTDTDAEPGPCPEPQVAIRAGRTYVPRLSRVDGSAGAAVGFDPGGTVLITGGSGRLGAILAHHLVRRHGVRHLLLASRAGRADPLVAELAEHGATVTAAACDVSDQQAAAELVARVPAEHPLTAVLHLAGVLDDSLVTDLTAEQLTRVLRPKVDGAWHLHEATRHLDLAAFVLFSSFAGTAGSGGQGNYASANAYLDALAVHRRARALPAVSLAWGLWAQGTGMTAAGPVRHSGSAVRPLATDHALVLFDAALASGRPTVAPVRLDPGALRRLAGAGALPPLLQGLVPAPARADAGPATGEALASRLAGLSMQERRALLLDLVRGAVAAIAGYDRPQRVEPDQPLKSIGFDSLAALQLRNRLNHATGLRLPATVVFDHPTPAALADWLGMTLAPEPDRQPVLASLDGLVAAVRAAPPDEEVRALLASTLERMLAELRPSPAESQPSDAWLESASADELLAFIDRDLGRAPRPRGDIGGR
ncbi:MAG TPA: beta-ketoacyl reductase, partial [Candidatus Eisenbacteria bacterium]|nr:beta-ketoacyl reductase [Candidatus Eisenbacteria bacterium]